MKILLFLLFLPIFSYANDSLNVESGTTINFDTGRLIKPSIQPELFEYTITDLQNKSENKLSISDLCSKFVQVKIFPNPASEYVNVSGLVERVVIKVSDNLGYIIYSGSEHIIDLSNFKSGIYIININYFTYFKLIVIK